MAFFYVFLSNLQSLDVGKYGFYGETFLDFCNWVGIYVDSRVFFLMQLGWDFFLCELLCFLFDG